MGACGCRKRGVGLSEEEALIQQYEEALGFGSRSVMQLVKGLFEVSVNSEITPGRFRSFLENVTAAKEGFNDLDKPLGRLYAEFKGSRGFRPEKLGVLMALLGAGPAQPRGEMIFMCCDLDHNEFLSLTEMTDLITFLAEIALFHLPTYAADCLELKKKTEEAAKVRAYVQLLAKTQKTTVDIWVGQLMEHKSNVTALKFSATFENLAKPLCSPSGLRLFALNPQQKLEAKEEDDSTYGM